MRREADEAEAEDPAILRFRAAVAAFGGENAALWLEVEDAVRQAIRKELDRQSDERRD